MTFRPLRLMCVDDQRTFRDALQIAVDAEPDLLCVGAFDNTDDAVCALAETTVDVVLMDLDLPVTDGIEGTRRIKATCPDVRVILLTGLADLDTFVRAVTAHADGFLAKDTPITEVLETVRAPATGGLSLDEPTMAALRDRVGDGAPAWAPRLTERELDVLVLLAAGVDVQTSARELGIRVNTCRGYVRTILTKLGAHSQLEAVSVARRTGILTA